MNRILSPASLPSSSAPKNPSVNSKLSGCVSPAQENMTKRSEEDEETSCKPDVEDAFLAEDPNMHFPATAHERQTYRTKGGKRVTPHQWAVYDFAMSIPKGKVTTYKEVASAVGGSPRSVGGALRNNPFSPYVPCHRVIASNLFVGGFCGEWGKDHKTGLRYNDKVSILSAEGVQFDGKGNLQNASEALWRP